MTDCEGDFKCPGCKGTDKMPNEKHGACLEYELRARIELLEEVVEVLRDEVIDYHDIARVNKVIAKLDNNLPTEKEAT